jgi:hypothetical protein
MPKGSRISAVVLCHRRTAMINEILTAWLKETADVWLVDCTPAGIKTELAIKTVRCSPDPGSKSRHAAALLTEGEFVIKADDDFIPLPGLVKSFEANTQAVGPAILGLVGRRFLGSRYYGNTQVFRGAEIAAPVRVDFVGICTFTPRRYLPFDLRGCETAIEDLFWQMKAFPDAPKYVARTKQYRNLAESLDKGCLFHNPRAREIRETFYKKYYSLYYQNGKPPWK